MLNIGILDSGGCSINVMPTPDDLGKLKNDVIFYVEHDSGAECGYSDNYYWQNGCNLLSSREEVIRKSDIILADDALHFNIHVDRKKIFITNFDVISEFDKLFCFMSEQIDLYSFHQNMLQNGMGNQTLREIFIDFVRFYLGDPVHPDVIYAFSKAKVISNGKVVYSQLINHLEDF
jgi:hypothetical protein